jgi:hypothetical protein
MDKLTIMRHALPVVASVPKEQDGCWPGDELAHDDHCTLTDHREATAAVEATAGLVWEFSSWSATLAWMNREISA